MSLDKPRENQKDQEEHHDHYWHVNTGDKVVHARRIKGRFRNYKWFAASLYLLFFFGPYLRWDGRQAVLFDIPARKFYLFSKIVWPQDVWVLALLLIFLAVLLFVTTAIASRVFCGYFCFQTVWTDIFTWIEEWLEGSPPKRVLLDRSAWNFKKFRIKVIKHSLWIIISLLTGVTFAAYFADAFWLWKVYLDFSAPLVAWVTLLFFLVCSYLFAGFMREQVCFWLCPYARIQGVMYDNKTILPTYDYRRGEPRTRLKKGGDNVNAGDCIDCNLCVAVCPTGIDIRQGQQEGCITCGICIDACAQIMERVGRPLGLIRYASLDELEGRPQLPLLKRPRVILYLFIILVLFGGMVFGLASSKVMDLKVLHERQPLFVRLSDGSIQNKYRLKLLNKTGEDLIVKIVAEGLSGLQMAGVEESTSIPVNKVTPCTVFIKVPLNKLESASTPLFFKVIDKKTGQVIDSYESMFIGPE